MANKSGKPATPVKKPFLTGSMTDERTVKSALGYFGVLVMTAIMSFLVCSMMGFENAAVRILLNVTVEVLILFIFYTNAIGKGTEAVARGEILYQRKEKGQEVSAGEKALAFHPLKGYLNALLGSIPFLVTAILLAVITHRQTTGIGTLPGWMSAYQRRSEIGDALVAYTTAPGMTLEDILRLIVRIIIMPFIAMVGAENKDGLLLMERLSPLLVLLPAAAYGSGYLQGRTERTKIHTGIAESNRRRVRKEKKARKARLAPKPRTPEQLN